MSRRLLLATAALTCLAGAARAEAALDEIPASAFAARPSAADAPLDQLPAGTFHVAQLLLTGAGKSVAGSGYTPPDLSSGLIAARGDSRSFNGGGVVPSTTTTYIVANQNGATWSAYIPQVSNNVIVFDDDYNLGVTGQTTAGLAGRFNIVGNKCNAPTEPTTAFCFGGPRLTSTAAANSGTNVMTFADTTGVVDGMYVFTNITSHLTVPTTVSSHDATHVTLSNNLLVTDALGQPVSFSAVAQTSPFWTHGGYIGTGYATTDPDLSRVSTGRYSPCNTPANLGALMIGVNDQSMAVSDSLTNIDYILDQDGPTLCNKLVIVTDEMPKGAATAFAELGTVNGSNQITVAHSGVWYDDGAVYYAPVSTGPPFVAGANDGVKLTNCGSGCTPAVGQYKVAAGVYTFNVAEIGIRMALYYRWTVTGALPYLNTIHNMLKSTSAAPFVDPDGGGTFAGVDGALHNRPWAVSALTWEDAVDATSGVLRYPKLYVTGDGGHPAPGWGRRFAKIIADAAAPYVGTTPKYTAPTVNNVNFDGSSSALTTVVVSPQCSAAAVGNLTKNYFITSPTPNTNTGVYSVGMKIYTIATTGIPQGTLIDCVDTANNQFHLAAPGTGNITNSGWLAAADNTNFIGNGGMSYATLTTPTVASCNGHCGTPTGLGTTITQGVPKGMTLGLDAASTTALNAGSLGFSYGVELNPFGDGYDDFVIQLQGVAGASAMDIAVTQIPIAATLAAFITPGDKIHAGCQIRVSAGPNGRLWGLTGTKVSTTLSSATPFNPPGITTNAFLNTVGTVGGAASLNPFVDAVDLAAGDLIIPALSPPIETAGMTGLTGSFKIDVQADAGVAVSATIRFTRCWSGKLAW